MTKYIRTSVLLLTITFTTSSLSAMSDWRDSSSRPRHQRQLSVLNENMLQMDSLSSSEDLNPLDDTKNLDPKTQGEDAVTHNNAKASLPSLSHRARLKKTAFLFIERLSSIKSFKKNEESNQCELACISENPGQIKNKKIKNNEEESDYEMPEYIPIRPSTKSENQ